MKSVFGETPPPASSTKPIMGHTLGAAGALETAVCWMVLGAKKGLPVHCWDGERDKDLPYISLVTDHGTAPDYEIASKPVMSNNFAFGGCNVSLILKRNNYD